MSVENQFAIEARYRGEQAQLQHEEPVFGLMGHERREAAHLLEGGTANRQARVRDRIDAPQLVEGERRRELRVERAPVTCLQRAIVPAQRLAGRIDVTPETADGDCRRMRTQLIDGCFQALGKTGIVGVEAKTQRRPNGGG